MNMKKIILTVAMLFATTGLQTAASAKPTAQTVAKSLNSLLTDVSKFNKKTNPFWDETGPEGVTEPILQKAKALAEKGDLAGALTTIDSVDGAVKKLGITEYALSFEVAGKQYNNRLVDMLKRVKQGLLPYAAEINVK